MCDEFNDILYLEGDQLSHADLVKHSTPILALYEERIINIRPYK
jgi:hypothetical protein